MGVEKVEEFEAAGRREDLHQSDLHYEQKTVAVRAANSGAGIADATLTVTAREKFRMGMVERVTRNACD